MSRLQPNASINAHNSALLILLPLPSSSRTRLTYLPSHFVSVTKNIFLVTLPSPSTPLKFTFPANDSFSSLSSPSPTSDNLRQSAPTEEIMDANTSSPFEERPKPFVSQQATNQDIQDDGQSDSASLFPPELSYRMVDCAPPSPSRSFLRVAKRTFSPSRSKQRSKSRSRIEEHVPPSSPSSANVQGGRKTFNFGIQSFPSFPTIQASPGIPVLPQTAKESPVKKFMRRTATLLRLAKPSSHEAPLPLHPTITAGSPIPDAI
ncbi:uncharacterized protein EI90DRAFT_3128841 [Cantharellus anzutake]|uniref:uncharacterized protein n=1 Tax=Cantharellus anzutake TaxID=1750568 RepID=UPI00190487C9|nr:uncharacterized protein EI90DRAFT_3128841 [Cantharellus anzutake]KAF8325470.1 hypothetical protein EI90DRAFT_3128841 [Cantharellus anzutake]